VPRIQIITKMGPGTILKNKILQGPKTKFFFYRDQNLNEAYLQGRVQYLSQILMKNIDTIVFLIDNLNECYS